MSEEEKKEMIETVLERSGIEMDVPSMTSFWEYVETAWPEELQRLSVSLIEQTAKYLQPVDEA